MRADFTVTRARAGRLKLFNNEIPIYTILLFYKSKTFWVRFRCHEDVRLVWEDAVAKVGNTVVRA